MTPEQRKAEFERLFKLLPGKNIERLREVASILCCAENTVRIWRLRNTARIIPQSKLNILSREIERRDLR